MNIHQGGYNCLVDTEGQLINPDRQDRSLRLVTLAGMLGSAFWVVVPAMPLIMLLEALNVSGIGIGMISSITYLGMIIQIPSAFYIEKQPRRKTFWITVALCARIVFFIPALALLLLPSEMRREIVALIFFAVTVYAFTHHASNAPWQSWMAEFIPAGRRGHFWGKRQIYCTLCFLLFSIICGRILDYAGNEKRLQGFSAILFFAAFFGAIEIILHVFVPEPKPHLHTDNKMILQRLVAPFKQRDFVYFMLASGGWLFCFSFIGQFGNVYLKRYFNLPYSHFALFQIASSLGSLISGVLFSLLADRIGTRVFSIFMVILAPLFHLPWFLLRPGDITLSLPFIDSLILPQPTLLMFIGLFLSGIISSGILLAQVSLLAVLTSGPGRTMAIALMLSGMGIISALGPLAGGAVMDFVEVHPLMLTLRDGVPVSFYHVMLTIHAFITWFIVLPFFIKIRPVENDIGIIQSIRRLLLYGREMLRIP